METLDRMIELRDPIAYDLHITRINETVFVAGTIHVVLDCVCVRCLNPFKFELNFEGELFSMSLSGENAVTLVGDSVDLTPFVREHIFLEFPAHPVCGPNCPGVPEGWTKKGGSSNGKSGLGSMWDVLDAL